MKNIRSNPLASLGAMLMAALWLLTASTQAATPGAAEVKKVVGTATYTDGQGGGPIKEGQVLLAGATITTGAGSYVDLDLKVNGNALRIEADTTLSLNKLEYTKAIDTVVNTELDVKKGSAVANVVNKLSKASKYEIKTPAGVAGIRGTVVRAATARIVCLIGRVEFRSVNGQMQLVIGGTVFAAGATGPVKATTVETTGLAVAATSCTANTQAANTVSQVVKQFTTVVAAEAAADAGPAGAAKAAADAAKAVIAQLLAAVKEAAATAPISIRAQAQLAAQQLEARAEAIATGSGVDGAILGTLAVGGTKEQAKANGKEAADQISQNKEIKDNAGKNGDRVADVGEKLKQAGAGPRDIITDPVDAGPAGVPVGPTGSPTGPTASNPSGNQPPTQTQVGNTIIFVSPGAAGSSGTTTTTTQK